MELTRLMMRLYFDKAMLGPGKVRLLEEIAEHGSISAAGRAMKMSYKRAWSLVEEMNAGFKSPLVDRSRGGAKGGGASLTPEGEAVLAAYRRLEEKAREAGSEEIALIGAMVAD
ncbi:LysR family transcriptional regulator [Thioclava sp.]|uniref:winged helix-turn-helix domain-containing protein n=1 Tax=Thioclava sp. TaxID=1933450 RepID=UPI003241CF09